MPEATHELDLDAHYTVEGYNGIVFYLLGYVERTDECQGHPDDGEFDGPVGESFYCDGSCEEPAPDHDWVRAVMVGDDRVHEVEASELTPIPDDEHVCSCGQRGCPWN